MHPGVFNHFEFMHLRHLKQTTTYYLQK